VVGDTHYRGKGFTLDPDSWVRYYKTLKAVIEDPSAFRLTDKQIEDAWAYAYRFFFDFPQPFPWHLVNPWENFEKNDIESIFNSRDWPQYERVLHYLAGEPMSWVS
jgi:hypothetical protein